MLTYMYLLHVIDMLIVEWVTVIACQDHTVIHLRKWINSGVNSSVNLTPDLTPELIPN